MAGVALWQELTESHDPSNWRERALVYPGMRNDPGSRRKRHAGGRIGCLCLKSIETSHEQSPQSCATQLRGDIDVAGFIAPLAVARVNMDVGGKKHP